MNSSGEWALYKLTLRYCNHGGSSLGARQFIRNRLKSFAEKNPQVQITLLKKANRHPLVIGEYTDYDKDVSVGLKNKNFREIDKIFEDMRNRTGRPVAKLEKPVYTKNETVQGAWYEGKMNGVEFKIKDIF